ncbi:23S rRNA (adenine(1618)-N(6))-methyltransferase RlmF [Flammeovirga agarivorans]|uniref:Ribosomal RNA large subunit methyltransferase F n=1 Tax=Flammeovirga agarivorans TaxID=2726742 RepID=A0A7X8XXY1_9BACT|nr:23S rRNA (adenine(1618)-N(6))-methyltransferase RlmF [Flammeovirga agarivorans]NLR93677.1 23S rRNA (adenine(1618)-N(6))-methyltransferase RlmF [Flammeovirga agarivorans]
MHPNNLHKKGYNFDKLVKAHPALAPFVIMGKSGRKTITFSDPKAVKALNSALLKSYYKVQYWDIPEGYLCPPIPGRADYILKIEDILEQTTSLRPTMVKGLDIGSGSNIIYPLIGKGMLGWRFVGTEVDDVAIDNALDILKKNKISPKEIGIRKQKNMDSIFKGVIREGDRFAFSMCNPPFHKSAEEALQQSTRKVKNLNPNSKEVTLNFGGQSNELWCEGGELAFIKKMIDESKDFKDQVIWFTSLVSKSTNVVPIKKHMKTVRPAEFHVIDMGQGQKKSRFVAWTFQSLSK